MCVMYSCFQACECHRCLYKVVHVYIHHPCEPMSVLCVDECVFRSSVV